MNETEQYRLIPANGRLRQDVISLLQQNELPVSDLDENKILFALSLKDEVIGTGGLEIFNDCAFLRSISVKKNWQGKGLGTSITAQLERLCKQKGITRLYLLTTSAQNFFGKQGYQVVGRNEAPMSIKNTSEFSSVCSSSAILMKKEIS